MQHCIGELMCCRVAWSLCTYHPHDDDSLELKYVLDKEMRYILSLFVWRISAPCSMSFYVYKYYSIKQFKIFFTPGIIISSVSHEWTMLIISST
jgi:hypothetical protein